MNLAFRHREAMEYRDGLLLHPIREQTVADEVSDFCEVAAVLVRVSVIILVVGMGFVRVVPGFVTVTVRVPGAVGVGVFVGRAWLRHEVHVELHAFEVAFLLARGVQVVTVQFQLGQFDFQLVQADAEVEHGPDEHVAADAAENVEVKSFHFASALIWLAA